MSIPRRVQPGGVRHPQAPVRPCVRALAHAPGRIPLRPLGGGTACNRPTPRAFPDRQQAPVAGRISLPATGAYDSRSEGSRGLSNPVGIHLNFALGLSNEVGPLQTSLPAPKVQNIETSTTAPHHLGRDIGHSLGVRLRRRDHGASAPSPRSPAAHHRHGESGHGRADCLGRDGTALRRSSGPERSGDGGGHGDLGEQQRRRGDGECVRAGDGCGQR